MGLIRVFRVFEKLLGGLPAKASSPPNPPPIKESDGLEALAGGYLLKRNSRGPSYRGRGRLWKGF
jgi:hypothetical protein